MGSDERGTSKYANLYYRIIPPPLRYYAACNRARASHLPIFTIYRNHVYYDSDIYLLRT